MRILLSKTNCVKCNYVKENFDLTGIIVYNWDELWGGLKKSLEETVEILTELAFSNAILASYVSLPILIIDGEMKDITPQMLKREKPIPSIKICSNYLKRKERSLDHRNSTL